MSPTDKYLRSPGQRECNGQPNESGPLVPIPDSFLEGDCEEATPYICLNLDNS